MSTTKHTYIALPVLLLCMGLTAGAVNEPELIRKLGSEKANSREAASTALTLRGPEVLGTLFQELTEERSTKSLWVRNTIEQIVNNATIPGAKKDRAATEQALIEVLRCKPGATEEKYILRKMTALRLLRLCGTEEAVPAVAAQLGVKESRDEARRALEHIPSSEATEALLSALSTTECIKCRIAYLNSLGMRADKTALPVIRDALQDDDANVRLAGIRAAGKFPDAKTADALWEMHDTGGRTFREAAANSLLTIAEGSLDRGKPKLAMRIYTRFCEQSISENLRCAGLVGLVKAAGNESLPLLVNALRDYDDRVRGVARDQLIQLPGEDVTRTLVTELERAAPVERLGLIQMLGSRNDPVAAAAVPVLLETITEENGDLREAAVVTLSAIPGEGVTDAVVDAVAGSSPGAQVALLRALGNRGDLAASPVALKATRSDNDSVRATAIETLGKIGDVSAVSVLHEAMQADSNPVKQAAARAVEPIVVALQKAGRKKEAADLCLAAANAAPNMNQLRRLVPIMQSLGLSEHLAGLAVKQGFITSWWVLGPIPNRESLRTGDVIPIDKPIDSSKPITIDGKRFEWKHVFVASPMGMLDLEQAVASQSNVGAYLYAEVRSPKVQDVLVKLGSDDDGVCWVNGEPAVKFIGDRGWSPDQDTGNAKLKAGSNSILLKILQGGAQWAASLRLTDTNNAPLQLEQKK